MKIERSCFRSFTLDLLGISLCILHMFTLLSSSAGSLCGSLINERVDMILFYGTQSAFEVKCDECSHALLWLDCVFISLRLSFFVIFFFLLLLFTPLFHISSTRCCFWLLLMLLLLSSVWLWLSIITFSMYCKPKIWKARNLDKTVLNPSFLTKY